MSDEEEKVVEVRGFVRTITPEARKASAANGAKSKEIWDDPVRAAEMRRKLSEAQARRRAAERAEKGESPPKEPGTPGRPRTRPVVESSEPKRRGRPPKNATSGAGDTTKEVTE